MDDFEIYLNESLKDPEFKKEWDESELEYRLMLALVSARSENNLTQAELAERCGIRQSNISRIENGTCLPSLRTLAAIAKGLGKTLKIELV